MIKDPLSDYGVALNSTGHGVFPGLAMGIRVQKNVIVSGNLIAAPVSGGGIFFGDSEDSLITNNIISDVPNGQRYVRLSHSAPGDQQDRITLRGNKLVGATTGVGSFGIWLDGVDTRNAVVEDNDFRGLTGSAIAKYQDSGLSTYANRNRM